MYSNRGKNCRNDGTGAGSRAHALRCAQRAEKWYPLQVAPTRGRYLNNETYVFGLLEQRPRIPMRAAMGVRKHFTAIFVRLTGLSHCCGTIQYRWHPFRALQYYSLQTWTMGLFFHILLKTSFRVRNRGSFTKKLVVPLPP